MKSRSSRQRQRGAADPNQIILFINKQFMASIWPGPSAAKTTRSSVSMEVEWLKEEHNLQQEQHRGVNEQISIVPEQKSDYGL